MRSALLLLALAAASCAGCAQASISAEEKGPRATAKPPAVAPPVASPMAPVPLAPAPSPFSEVARVAGNAYLVRPTRGPVLAVTEAVNTLYELTASGEASLVEPVSELGVTSEMS